MSSHVEGLNLREDGIGREDAVVSGPTVGKSGEAEECRELVVREDEDKGSLHVQFEDARGESPACSLSSGSSSDEDEEESSSEDLDECRAPDGGYGWVVVVAAFFTYLIADGITFTFGVVYVELLKHFKEGKSKTAWIGGIFMAMPLLSGPVASYLTDRFGCRRVCISGALLASAGFVASSQADSIEALIFTFGVVSGFGLAMCFVSAVVIVAYYFDKKRSLATGLSVCGSGLGTFVFAPLSSALIREYGWRGTTLILAGLLLNICVCGALMRDLEWTKIKAKAQRKDRKMKHRNKRSLKSRSQSLRTATSSVGSLSPTKTLSAEELKRLITHGEPLAPTSAQTEADACEEMSRLCSSVIHLPTFVRHGEKVPLEVLQLLSSNHNVYTVLLKNYPGLLIPSRSNSLDDGGCIDDEMTRLNNNDRSMSDAGPIKCMDVGNGGHAVDMPAPRRRVQYPRTGPSPLHRRSLTYRGAMLNVERFRALSCPDICRGAAVVATRQTPKWHECLWDLGDVLADMLDVSHFLDARFSLFAVSNFILYSWYHVPYVFIADKAVEMGFSEPDASMLIAVLGVLNTFGEVLLGWLGDRPWVNAGAVYACCMTACGVFTFLVPTATSYEGLATLSGGFGLSIAANYALASVILVELTSLDRFTNAYGLLLFVQGTANLIGPPIAGWLYDITGNYDLSFYLAGLSIIGCGGILLVLPAQAWLKRRSQLAPAENV